MPLFCTRIFYVAVLLGLLSSCNAPSAKAKKEGTAKPVAVKAVDSIITIQAVGDLVLGSTYPDSSGLPPEDGKTLFSHVSDILNDADITCGNLEAPLIDRGGTIKDCRDPKVCYMFKTPTRYGKLLKAAGFDFLNLANNHSHDFGTEGADTTAKVLRSLGIGYAGLRNDTPYIIQKDGIRYGYAAFAPYSSTCYLNNIEAAAKTIKALAAKVDIVIVSMHGGAEGPEYRHVTKEKEKQFGCDLGNVYKFAHAMVDAGADVVLGVGPHVWRGAEIYKDRCIFYSIGNFCIYGKISRNGYCGTSAIVRLNVKKDGTFQTGQLIPVKIRNGGIPELDKDSAAIPILKELSEADFPNTAPLITQEGKILYPSLALLSVPDQVVLPVADKMAEASIADKYYVISGSFPTLQEAKERKKELYAKGLKAEIMPPMDNQTHYRVSAAVFKDKGRAKVFRKEHEDQLAKDAWIMASRN